MNFYEILGVNKGAGNDEIKRAYRKLSYEKHPDRNPDSGKEYQKINEAYETLKNKATRREYDYSTIGTDVIDNANINNFFSEMLSSAIDQGIKKGKGKQIDDFASIFGMPISGDNTQFDPSIFMNSADMFVSPPDDLLLEEVITYQQAYNGCYIPVNIEREIIKGRTRKIEKELIYITIESGVDNNEIINITGKGHVKDNICSDIKVKVVLENSSDFNRRGIDLILKKKITFQESLCGFKFIIEHIDGSSIQFSSSRGNIIQNGDEKQIKNMGFKRNGLTGNLILSFHVLAPSTLTEEQLTVIEEVFS